MFNDKKRDLKDNSNIRNVLNVFHLTLDKFVLLPLDHQLITLKLNSKNIGDMKVTYDLKSNRLKYRKIDFQIPNVFIGDISKFNEEQYEEYIKILQNSASLDESGNITRLGLLDGSSYKNILNGKASPFEDSLNAVNQQFAQQIVGEKYDKEYLKCHPFSNMFNCFSDYNLVANYVCGTLDEFIKDSMGKLYMKTYYEYTLENLFNSDFKKPKFISNEDFKKSYYSKHSKNEAINQLSTNDEKYNDFIMLVGDKSKEEINDYMASQLLERGFIYCKDTNRARNLILQNIKNDVI